MRHEIWTIPALLIIAVLTAAPTTAAYTVSGMVVDPTNNYAPVTGAIVSIHVSEQISSPTEFINVYSDTEGHYSIIIPEGLSGFYYLYAHKQGHHDSCRILYFPDMYHNYPDGVDNCNITPYRLNDVNKNTSITAEGPGPIIISAAGPSIMADPNIMQGRTPLLYEISKNFLDELIRFFDQVLGIEN